jgi:hypothetical protein
MAFIVPVGAAKDNEKPKVNLNVIRASFLGKSDELKAYLKKGDLQAGKLTEYYIFFKSFSENQYIEDATRIYRDYFVKSTEYSRVIMAIKMEIERAEEINDMKDPRYIAAKEKCQPTIEAFIKFFEDPPRIKSGQKNR